MEIKSFMIALAVVVAYQIAIKMDASPRKKIKAEARRAIDTPSPQAPPVVKIASSDPFSLRRLPIDATREPIIPLLTSTEP